MNLTPVEKVTRVVFLLCVVIILLDLFYWRAG